MNWMAWAIMPIFVITGAAALALGVGLVYTTIEQGLWDALAFIVVVYLLSGFAVGAEWVRYNRER